MPDFTNIAVSDMRLKCGSIFGLHTRTCNRFAASCICFGICKLPKRFYSIGFILMCLCNILHIDFDLVTFLFLATVFVFLRLAQSFRAITTMTHQVSFLDVSLNEPAVTHNGHLCFKRCLGTAHYDCNGRVLQRHEDGTVSVVFGCESGACLLHASCARICCVCDA